MTLCSTSPSLTRAWRSCSVIEGCAAKRAPPLAPPVFKEDLSTKTFTSPKADLETVGNLYEKEFDEKLGEATRLDYARLQWTDADVVKLCGAIATGKLVKLEDTHPLRQPDWRRRRRRARGGGGQAAAAPPRRQPQPRLPQHLPASQGRAQGRPAQLSWLVTTKMTFYNQFLLLLTFCGT